MHLKILGQAIVFTVINVSLQLHPSYIPTYPLIAIKRAKIYDRDSSPEYHLEPKFRPIYPLPEMNGPVFNQPLHEVSRPIVRAPLTGEIANDTMPYIHQRLDTNFTAELSVTNTNSVRISIGRNNCRNSSSSSISFNLLQGPVTTSAFCFS